MKKPLVSLLFVGLGITITLAWGGWGHQHINRAAVLALPAEMRPFFYNHIDFLTEEAVVPDLRKYTINDKAEFPRHFINLETYDADGNIANLPRTMAEAKTKYGDSVLNKAGMLPWYIQQMEDKLTKAFKAGRKTEILFLAADLGHYIGDAHMPLHTALNHDGQLTGQKGIHALWEGQLPEFFGDKYDLYTGPVRYIDDITGETWKMVDSSHRLAGVLLSLDKKMSRALPLNKVYLLDSSGHMVVNQFGDPVHTREYATHYHEKLRGMVEQQLRGAIAETASYWYTAWVNAGKPDLSGFDPVELTERNKAALSRDDRRWHAGKIDMVIPDREFVKWAKQGL